MSWFFFCTYCRASEMSQHNLPATTYCRAGKCHSKCLSLSLRLLPRRQMSQHNVPAVAYCRASKCHSKCLGLSLRLLLRRQLSRHNGYLLPRRQMSQQMSWFFFAPTAAPAKCHSIICQQLPTAAPAVVTANVSVFLCAYCRAGSCHGTMSLAAASCRAATTSLPRRACSC